MMIEGGIILGHLFSAVGIQVDPAKVETIFNFPTPKKPMKVHRFICYARYYRHFIEKFSMIEFPLFQLLPKYVEFVWIDTCEATFLEIKELVFKLPFHISIDSSHTIVG